MTGMFLLQGETEPFKPYTHRYHVPYKASESTAPFWYSIKRGSAYIIVLASYSAYGKHFSCFPLCFFNKKQLFIDNTLVLSAFCFIHTLEDSSMSLISHKSSRQY